MNTTPSQNENESLSLDPTPAWGSADSSATDAVTTPEPGPPPMGARPPGSAGPNRPQSTVGAGLFDGIRRRGVVRPDSGRLVAGVAAGLAAKWGVSPVAVRVAFVVLALFGGLGVFLYGLGWMLLPHSDGRIHLQQVLNGTLSAGFFGALATMLIAVPAGAEGPGWFGILVVVALVVWLVRRNRSVSA